MARSSKLDAPTTLTPSHASGTDQLPFASPPPQFNLRVPPHTQDGISGDRFEGRPYSNRQCPVTVGQGHQRGRQDQGNFKRYEENEGVSLSDVEGSGTTFRLVAAEPAPVEFTYLDTAPAVVHPAVPAPALATADVPILTPPIAMDRAFDILSPKQQVAIRRAYARMDSNVPMPIPVLPFASEHYVSELVEFTSALRDAASSLRLDCDDPHPSEWTSGLNNNLERHTMRAGCVASPQAPSLKTIISAAFEQGGRVQDDEGPPRPDALQYVIRALYRGLNKATPAAMMQALQT